MNHILAPLSRKCVVVFIDDILIYSKSLEQHLQHVQMPVPTCVKEVRSFLGLVGYYRRFVKNFGSLARSLTELLEKGVVFAWTSTTKQAFQALKKALTSAPMLAFPNFSQPFVVETDASNKGIGAVLQQARHPIAFVSRALGPKNQGLSTYEKERLAILMAVDHWQSYM